LKSNSNGTKGRAIALRTIVLNRNLNGGENINLVIEYSKRGIL
jgi:hypothetical protein